MPSVSLYDMRRALAQHDGHVRAAARALDIDAREARRLVRKFGLADWPGKLQALKRRAVIWRRAWTLRKLGGLDIRIHSGSFVDVREVEAVLAKVEAAVLARAAASPPDLRYPGGRARAAAELAVRWSISVQKAQHMIDAGYWRRIEAA